MAQGICFPKQKHTHFCNKSWNNVGTSTKTNDHTNINFSLSRIECRDEGRDNAGGIKTSMEINVSTESRHQLHNFHGAVISSRDLHYARRI